MITGSLFLGTVIRYKYLIKFLLNSLIILFYDVIHVPSKLLDFFPLLGNFTWHPDTTIHSLL